MYFARSGSPGRGRPRRTRRARRGRGSASARAYSSCRRIAERLANRTALVEPTLEQVLEFCSAEARRARLPRGHRPGAGFGRFVGRTVEDGRAEALCHAGANLVPSGQGCGAFAEATAGRRARMIIGEERAVGELWAAAASALPPPREDRPGQPVYAIDGAAPARRHRAARGARSTTSSCCCPPAPRRTRASSGSTRSRATRTASAGARGSRSRTAVRGSGSRTGRSSSRPRRRPGRRTRCSSSRSGSTPRPRNRGYGQRGLRDLFRLLLERYPRVCLFVRTDNPPAIRLYERVGMERVLSYRSILF